MMAVLQNLLIKPFSETFRIGPPGFVLLLIFILSPADTHTILISAITGVPFNCFLSAVFLFVKVKLFEDRKCISFFSYSRVLIMVLSHRVGAQLK